MSLSSVRRACVIASLIGLAGCFASEKVKGQYCDTPADCPASQPLCDTQYHTCFSNNDGGLDQGMDANVDGNSDGAVDMAEPDLLPPADLMPECTVATTATACAQASEPICESTSQTCRACSSAADDTACSTRSAGALPRCKVSGTNTGRCVACATATDQESADCDDALPVCTDGGTCRTCSVHGECLSGVCIFDGADAGKCAPSALVALVNNGGITVALCETGRPTRDGNTAATAYCNVSEAVAETAARPFALIAGSSEPYGGIMINSRTLTLVGPGPSGTTARLFTLAQPAIGVMVSGTQAAVLVVDGLDLGGDVSTKTSNGVFCSKSGGASSATITVRNSLLHDSSGAGIDSSACTTSVMQSTVSGNAGGGIAISGTATYKLESVLVFRNGTGGGSGTLFGGIRLDSNGGSVANATVYANNSQGGVAAGIGCATATPIVLNTVILDSVGGTDVESGKCNFQSSAYKSVSATRDLTTCSAADLFMNAGSDQYQVKTGGTAPCSLVDGGAGSFMSVNAPVMDFTGLPRPGIGGYDIGAYESQ